jgi:hypothetical protein
MEKEFVPYELAVKLKALGFDEPCFRFYSERYTIDSKTGGDIKMGEFYLTDTPRQKTIRCKAPTFSQAFRWFREKYELFCWIEKFHVDETYIFQIPPANFTKIQGHYITYEEAELACLKKLIQIIKTKI